MKVPAFVLAGALAVGGANVTGQPIEKQPLLKGRLSLSPSKVQDNQQLEGYLTVLGNSTSSDSEKITALKGICSIFKDDSTRSTISSDQANRTVDILRSMFSKKVSENPEGRLYNDILYIWIRGAIDNIYYYASSANYHIDPARTDEMVRAFFPRFDPTLESNGVGEPVSVGAMYSYQGAELSTFNELITVIKKYLTPVNASYDLSPHVQCLAYAIPSRSTDLSQIDFDILSNSTFQYQQLNSPNGFPDVFAAFLKACPTTLLLNSSTVVSIANQLTQISPDQWKNASDNWPQVGGMFTWWCFIVPVLFDNLAIQPLFTFSSQTARDISSASPKWDQISPIGDFTTIFVQSQIHRGQPFVKTLFEDYNLTELAYYAPELLEHLYINRDRPTGKPIVLSVIGKHNWDGAALSDGLPFFNLNQFDVRAIEASTDETFVDFAKAVYERLGNAPFAMVYLSGHGDQNEIEFEAKLGEKGNPKIQDVPSRLDLTDGDLLKRFKPYILPKQIDIILNSCSVGQGTTNIAQFVAQALEARSFGPIDNVSGITSITFHQHSDGVEVDQVVYNSGQIPTAVFDYRSHVWIDAVSESIPTTTGLKAFPNPFQSSIDFDVLPAASVTAHRAPICTIYDVLGRRVTQVEGQPSGEGHYQFHWDAGTLPAGTYFARLEDGGKIYNMPLQKR